MAHTSRVGTEDKQQYALQELRTSSKAAAYDSPQSPQNPFMSTSEVASMVSPIEEYEEPDVNDPYDDGTLIRPGHHRSDTVGTTASRDDGNGPRRTSRFNLIRPPNANASPLLICLHGSNDSCMRSWMRMLEVLYKSGHTMLLFDRPPLDALGGADLKPHRAVSELRAYLTQVGLHHGPYVFIAHAYGATVARLFLEQYRHQVAGMVLVETGQETALSRATEEEQYNPPILGNKPLAVVRGNFMRSKQNEWVKAAAMARTEAQKAQLEPQRLMLERWEAEDVRLKKKQLGLSTNTHYCQVSNCGSHPIREHPDVVVEEVRWVMGQLAANGARQTSGATHPGLRRNISSAGAGLRRGFSTRLTNGLQRTFSKRDKV